MVEREFQREEDELNLCCDDLPLLAPTCVIHVHLPVKQVLPSPELQAGDDVCPLDDDVQNRAADDVSLG